MEVSEQAILQSNEDSLPGPKVASKVIGRLKISPHWICQLGNDIYALNHHRFEENAIYERLIGSRSLNTIELPEPIKLDDDKKWNGELNETLLNMPRDGEGLVTDERIRQNGFVVKVGRDGLGGILLGVPRDVNFMGPSDLSVSKFNDKYTLIMISNDKPFLKSILEGVKYNADAPVSDTRPLKVQSFLQAEAVRMVRQNPPGIDLETARKTWATICGKMSKGHETPSCFHGRPVCQLLTSLPR